MAVQVFLVSNPNWVKWSNITSFAWVEITTVVTAQTPENCWFSRRLFPVNSARFESHNFRILKYLSGNKLHSSYGMRIRVGIQYDCNMYQMYICINDMYIYMWYIYINIYVYILLYYVLIFTFSIIYIYVYQMDFPALGILVCRFAWSLPCHIFRYQSWNVVM